MLFVENYSTAYCLQAKLSSNRIAAVALWRILRYHTRRVARGRCAKDFNDFHPYSREKTLNNNHIITIIIIYILLDLLLAVRVRSVIVSSALSV